MYWKVTISGDQTGSMTLDGYVYPTFMEAELECRIRFGTKAKLEIVRVDEDDAEGDV